jgi:hypothetical protein
MDNMIIVGIFSILVGAYLANEMGLGGDGDMGTRFLFNLVAIPVVSGMVFIVLVAVVGGSLMMGEGTVATILRGAP